MSTSGSYTPPAQPACAYDPYMTHAEALALRDAGQLDPNCVVVITDGPVIGVPGFTSPTQIELNPVGPSDIGRDARVHTDFDNVAFSGLYNIDGAAAGGDINHLTDHWNNTVSDEDAGAPTVHTQFPFHMSSNLLRDNNINDCTLTGWAEAVAAGVLITDNDFLNAGVHLTGMADGQLVRNVVQGPQITISSPSMLFNNNDIRNAPVTLAGTSALPQAFNTNTILSGQVQVTAATTARVTMDRNVIGGVGATGPRITVDGATGTSVTISGNRIFGQGTDPSNDLRVSGAATFGMSGCELTAPRVNIDGAAGGVQFSSSKLSRTTITKDAASTAPLTVQDCELGLATITIGPANAALTNLFNVSRIRQGLFTLNGPVAAPGRNDFTGTDIQGANVTVAATATAGVQISGGFHAGVTVNQNRAAGTAVLALFDCDTRGFTTITDNGTVDPVQQVGFNRCQFRDSIVNVGDLAARSVGSNAIMQQVDMIGSTFNVTGLGATGFIDKGRLTGCNLTTAFAVDTFEMLGGTKTLTATQSNKLFNPAFDNYV